MTAEILETVIPSAFMANYALAAVSLLFAWAVGDLEAIEAKDRPARHRKEHSK